MLTRSKKYANMWPKTSFLLRLVKKPNKYKSSSTCTNSRSINSMPNHLARRKHRCLRPLSKFHNFIKKMKTRMSKPSI